MHENNVCELKIRERELDDSRMTENVLRKKLSEVQKDLETIMLTNNKRRDRVLALFNFRRVKILMKDRSDAIKRDIAQDLNLLDRISG